MEPDFPSLAHEIAEPHLNMNIKVAAFKVSEKSSYKRYFSQVMLFIAYATGQILKHSFTAI